MTEPASLQQIDRTYVRFQRRKLSFFSGCDYHRMSSHPAVLAALEDGLAKYGLSVAASRLTTGNHALYTELEARLAAFFGAPSATLVPTGYLSNLVAAQTLVGTFSHALIDESSHPSLADAAALLDCPVLRFKHRDSQDLACSVRRCGPAARLILLTDGMFSRDGAVAPLDEYLEVLPRDAVILVDDAHAAGVIGKTGRGSLEETGVGRGRIVQAITLSKAFGVYGGAILGSQQLRRRILERSHLFVGSTPLPLPLVSAALRSTEILDADRQLKQRLDANSNRVKSLLRAAGLAIPNNPGPIVALCPRTAAGARKVKNALLDGGVFPAYIRYPGGPPRGYFRFVFSSQHQPEQLARLSDVVTEVARLVTAYSSEA